MVRATCRLVDPHESRRPAGPGRAGGAERRGRWLVDVATLRSVLGTDRDQVDARAVRDARRIAGGVTGPHVGPDAIRAVRRVAIAERHARRAARPVGDAPAADAPTAPPREPERDA